jgi:hypothetical protein
MYTVVFSVNLERLTAEKIGPNTNQSSPTLLHPDLHCNPENIATARTNMALRDDQKISWLPGFLAAENIDHENGHTFTAYGQKAAYLKATYASDAAAAQGTAWLTVVSES